MNDSSIISAVNEDGRAFDLSLLQSATYVANYLPAFEQGLWRQYSIGNRVYTHDTVQEYVESEEGMNCTSYGAFRRAVEAVTLNTDPKMAKAKQQAAKLLALLPPAVEVRCREERGNPEGARAPRNPETGLFEAMQPNTYNVSKRSNHGNSKAYLTDKLVRDQGPEILEKIGKGKEFPTVRAAAQRHGIVKPGVQITASMKPEKAADSLLDRLGEEWCAELITVLTDRLTNA